MWSRASSFKWEYLPPRRLKISTSCFDTFWVLKVQNVYNFHSLISMCCVLIPIKVNPYKWNAVQFSSEFVRYLSITIFGPPWHSTGNFLDEIVQCLRHEPWWIHDSPRSQPISIVWEHTAPTLNRRYCYWCRYLKQWGDNLSGGHERTAICENNTLAHSAWWIMGQHFVVICISENIFIFKNGFHFI
jgi:hypothetical protein